MRNYFSRALVASVLIISGCASSIEDLRGNPPAKATVEQPVKTVYKKARSFVHKCWATNMITAQVVMESDFDDAEMSGHVEPVLHGGFGTQVSFSIEMQQAAPERTTLQVYSIGRGQQSGPAIIEQFNRFMRTGEC